ncbi:MAG TPA: protease HtpX [bacterium (Candidatus Stahlbacteria)]|nr:protease HtpX [Candidatus Stahlbacteria bacterium]
MAIRTTILMVLLTVILVAIGGLVAGLGGAIFAFILALIFNFLAYWFSDRIVLAATRAMEISEGEFPELYRVVRSLSTQARIPMPRLYLISSESANAFATGRNPQNAAIVVTKGLINLLNEEELAGVIGHELSHIRNRDILISSIAATLAGAVTIVASWARWGAILGGLSDDEQGGVGLLPLLIIGILAPLGATIIQLAISRAREYGADEGSASITRKPLSLANALRKLEIQAKKRPLLVNPSYSHLFIVNPLRGRDFITTLFSTHPPIEDRIRRLEEIARKL